MDADTAGIRSSFKSWQVEEKKTKRAYIFAQRLYRYVV